MEEKIDTTKSPTPCSFGLSAIRQQYFSLRTNQPLVISQQYFSLRTNQHRLSAFSQTNGQQTCGLSNPPRHILSSARHLSCSSQEIRSSHPSGLAPSRHPRVPTVFPAFEKKSTVLPFFRAPQLDIDGAATKSLLIARCCATKGSRLHPPLARLCQLDWPI
jgi:hypothetical protein